MRIDFRQGVVSYQDGGFLNLNGSNVDILANVKPVRVSVAHMQTNYLHSEDNTFSSAWSGPFLSNINYWLYWEFNSLTFARSFNMTTLEPVAQSVEPGLGDTPIIDVTPGDAGIGSFVIDGHSIQNAGKIFAVIGSTGNDGNYTVTSSTYNTGTGETTINVAEEVPSAVADGVASLDIDSSGDPLKISGRMWYNTATSIQYILQGSVWVEIIAVFAALLTNGNTFISVSINGGSNFTGTQIGNTSSVLAGRVLFDEAGDSIRRDDGTFFTTEDQFFSTASRVDGIRLESNVSRAQYIGALGIAAFTPVAYIAEGKIEVGQYDDTSQTVIGMLMEDLLHNEVGAVVIQGVITNPAWNWLLSASVGDPLWVDNGTLNTIDPHVSDAVTYPQGTVPVARILSSNSVVFEQGLGGVGEQGPAGSISDLPPATSTDLGAVTLLTPSSDSEKAWVISDLDDRLDDARIPLPHLHIASEVSLTPLTGYSSTNVQTGMEEIDTKKLNLAGGTMSNFLTLHSIPTADFHAATKNYVDQLVLGLVWLEPIDLINMISDIVTTPPISPEEGDAYIVPPAATGDWSLIAAGNIAHWDGTIWQDLGAVTAVDPNGARFGISFTSTTTASGSFLGQDNNIAQYDAAGNLTGFETPSENNAVYVSNGISSHAFTQYAFNGVDWVLMGGGNPLVVDDTTIELTGNIISVKPASTGGTADALLWDGLSAPVTPGTNLQILQTDGANNTAWVDPTDTGIGKFIDSSISISSNDLALSSDDGTDNNNIGIGDNAGLGTTGVYNVLLGSNSGQNLTSGGWNIGIGNDALFGDIAQGLQGNNNIGLGWKTGESLKFGSDNTFLGWQAGRYLYNAGNNVAIGASAMSSINGSYGGAYSNVAIGSSAGKEITDASNNIFLGSYAGRRIQTGYGNIGIGSGALQGSVGNTNNDGNIAIGINALELNTTGSYNLGIGYKSGVTITSGGSNVVIGPYSGSGITTESDQLRIANNITTTLISGDFLTETLHIDGALTFKSYGETLNTVVATSGTIDFDISLGNAATVTLTGAATFTFTTSLATTALMILMTDASTNITWPVTVKWDGGVEPTWSTTGEDVVIFNKIGASWYGAASIIGAA